MSTATRDTQVTEKSRKKGFVNKLFAQHYYTNKTIPRFTIHLPFVFILSMHLYSNEIIEIMIHCIVVNMMRKLNGLLV